MKKQRNELLNIMEAIAAILVIFIHICFPTGAERAVVAIARISVPFFFGISCYFFYKNSIWVYEYQGDGLTKAGNSLFMRNPRGYGLFLREKTEFLGQSRLKLWYTLTCDMSGTYSAGEIAAFLGAPGPLIWGSMRCESCAVNFAGKAIFVPIFDQAPMACALHQDRIEVTLC